MKTHIHIYICLTSLHAAASSSAASTLRPVKPPLLQLGQQLVTCRRQESIGDVTVQTMKELLEKLLKTMTGQLSVRMPPSG